MVAQNGLVMLAVGADDSAEVTERTAGPNACQEMSMWEGVNASVVVARCRRSYPMQIAKQMDRRVNRALSDQRGQVDAARKYPSLEADAGIHRIRRICERLAL